MGNVRLDLPTTLESQHMYVYIAVEGDMPSMQLFLLFLSVTLLYFTGSSHIPHLFFYEFVEVNK